MNIGIFAAYGGKYKGNFIRQIELLAQKLLEDGNTIYFIFPEANKDFEWIVDLSKKYNVSFIDINDSFINKYKKISKLIKSKNINLVYTHFGLYDNECLVYKFINKHIECIIHAHSENKIDSNKCIKAKIKRLIKLKMLCKYVSIIAAGESIYKEYDGKGKYKTYLIKNGIDFSRFTNHTKKKRSKTFLMMGHDIYIKGVDIVINAFDELKLNPYYEELELLIVTAANERILLNYIENLYGIIPKWIKILPATDSIEEYYKKTDFFISASRQEGFSMALSEVLYMKKPCIISDILGTKWASQFKTVIEFENENIIDLKNKIVSLLEFSHEEELENTKNKVIELFRIDKWVDDVTNVLYTHL